MPYDFHNSLSPIQFERLVRDILQVKYADHNFRSYSPGKDDGIDIQSISGPSKIICQCKLYRNNFSQLKYSLTQNVSKTRKLNPDKFIIATSCSLTPKNILDILDLYAGVNVTAEDIWDREILNQLLGFKEYKPVLRNHLNLFLSNLHEVEDVLRLTINNGVLQYSSFELEKIKDEIRFYVPIDDTVKAIKQLDDEKAIILTGAAGAGKTVTARLLINNLISRSIDQIEFFKVTNISDAWFCYKKDRTQIFLLDDY